ncbi:MAG: SLBB domain-containing protein [Acidobacteriaceae bacterium]
MPVRADYVVGPGDELLIRAWGKIDLDAKVVVDRNGQIDLPAVGPINVAGVRFDQLNSYIHSAVGRFFKDFDLNVNIGQLRSIQVYVLGYARRPGTYTVSSLSTLVDALFASGGPASNGSLRHVQLKRGEGVVTDLDVYDLVLKGDKSRDAALRPGDVIYIPHVGPMLALAGSVNTPAIYELRGATTLAEAVESAGGLSSVAGGTRASLERIDNRSGRYFDEFPLDTEGLHRLLQDGDIVRIFPVSSRITNAVMLRGNVSQPGRYLWHQGMRISTLIPTREALITRDYWNTQNSIAPTVREDEFSIHYRQRQDPENPDESLAGPSSSGLFEDSGGAADGGSDVDRRLHPGQSEPSKKFPMDNSQPVPRGAEKDFRADVRRRSSEINWNYAVIERMDRNDLTTQLIPFNLGAAIQTPSSPDDKQILAGDVVTIFSQRDVPVSAEDRARFVQVEGEIKAPGVYRVAAGETLRDVVRRAGGLSSHAYLYAAELDRDSTRKEQQRQIAQMVERMQRDMSSRYNSAGSSINAEDRADQRLQIQQQQTFLDKLALVQPTGRIVLEMKPGSAGADAVPDLPLEDGDRFSVPLKLDTVQVLGAVYNENAFRYRPGKRLSNYLNIAGGPTREADSRRIFILRADGTVVSRQQHTGLFSSGLDSMDILPGDAIVVPTQFKTGSVLRGIRDWSQVFAQFALGAAAVNVIR